MTSLTVTAIQPKVEGYMAVHDEGREWLVVKVWADDYSVVLARCPTEERAKELVKALTAQFDGTGA